MAAEYERRKYKRGEVIFSEGERAAEAYLIQAGKVHLFRNENGIAKELDTIGEGQIFGEMGVISDMNRMASADAVTDVTLICCHRQELKRRLKDLDKDRREAMRFLIVYCQEYLPFEMMENRPTNKITAERDAVALQLIRHFDRPGELDALDSFMAGLYRVLIGYAKRRLPTGLDAKSEG